MDSLEVKLARLEEAMVTVKGDTKYIRELLRSLTESHWKLSGKVIGIASTISIATTIALKFLVK